MPREAAMEAARGMGYGGRPFITAAGEYVPIETVAEHLGRVDAVVRKAISWLEVGDPASTIANLRTLLLPEPKPDAVKVLADATGLVNAELAIRAIHAAGGRIVFGEGRDGK